MSSAKRVLVRPSGLLRVTYGREPQERTLAQAGIVSCDPIFGSRHHRHPKALTGLMNIAGATVIWLAINFAAS